MTKVTKEELLKIAQITNVQLYDDEIPGLIAQIDGVLSYAERVQEIARDVDIPSNKNVNVVREDVIIETDREPLLQQGPEVEQGYFVVPMILEHK